MAVRKAVEGWTLIPEGEQVLKITKIDDSKYTDFDKLVIYFKDENGNQLRQNFSFTNKDEEPNETADRMFTLLGRLALQDQTLDEIDYEEFAGCFIVAEIEHSEYGGREYANIKKYIGSADGFDKKKTSPKTKKEDSEEPKSQSLRDRIQAKKK